MFQTNQPVSVLLSGRPIHGRIIKSKGKTGFYVRIPWTTTTQNFTTGKITTSEGSRDCYFKTSEITALSQSAA